MESPDLPQNQPDPKSLLLMIGQQIHETELDCSHFVQYLYEQAGLYYGYAPSRTLYDGMDGFKRVAHPRPGDLIVWRGHVGISSARRITPPGAADRRIVPDGSTWR